VADSETRGQTKPTNAVMSVDRGKERGTNAVMRVLFVGDVGAVTIAEFFCEAKVDDIDQVGGLTGAHDKVGGLDVAVDEVVRMNEFNTG